MNILVRKQRLYLISIEELVTYRDFSENETFKVGEKHKQVISTINYA